MLKRIYIDNFQCLVKFELSVDSINLFIGPNGAGKSTVFDVLWRIQAFVSGGGKVDAFFNSIQCTR
jgi:predicted ATPase